MESNFEPRVTSGYLMPGGSRASVIEARRVQQLLRVTCVVDTRPSTVGGIRQAADLLTTSPMHALKKSDALNTGIPPSARRRT